MFCPKCGTKLDDGTKFCTECGASMQPALSAIRGKEAPAPIPPSDNPIPNGVKPKKKTGLIVGITALLAMLIVGGIFAFMSLKPIKTYPVNVQINAEGLDVSTGTKVPLHVSGITTSNKEVDNTYYVGTSDSDFELEPGTYTFSVEASPIAADGTIYATENVSTSASLSDEGALATDEELTLTPIPAAEVTDDQINAAYEAAKEGGAESAEKADELKRAAETKRDTAVEEAASKTASGNPVSIFQVANLLAMDPANLAQFFSDQNLSTHVWDEILVQVNETFNCWDVSDTYVSNILGSGLYQSAPEDVGFLTGGAELVLGNNLSAWDLFNNIGWASESSDAFDTAKLQAGAQVTDIALSTANVQALTDDSLQEFLKICGLPAGNYKRFNYNKSSPGSSDYCNDVCYSGVVEIAGRKSYWFVFQSDLLTGQGEKYVTTQMGCLSEDTCRRMYSFEFSREASWDSLSDDEKVDWICKSYVQLRNTGNGGDRINVVTGETEYLKNDYSGYSL